MSKQNRQAQHRPERDAAKNREMADLRRENHKLKKQVAQVRKQAVRAIDARFDPLFGGINRTVAPKPEMKGCVLTREVIQDSFDKMNEHRGGPPPVVFVPPGICYSCGCATKRLELGPKVAEVCPECGWRQVLKPT